MYPFSWYQNCYFAAIIFRWCDRIWPMLNHLHRSNWPIEYRPESDGSFAHQTGKWKTLAPFWFTNYSGGVVTIWFANYFVLNLKIEMKNRVVLWLIRLFSKNFSSLRFAIGEWCSNEVQINSISMIKSIQLARFRSFKQQSAPHFNGFLYPDKLIEKFAFFNTFPSNNWLESNPSSTM